jgi:hypothetical protein
VPGPVDQAPATPEELPHVRRAAFDHSSPPLGSGLLGELRQVVVVFGQRPIELADVAVGELELFCVDAPSVGCLEDRSQDEVSFGPVDAELFGEPAQRPCLSAGEVVTVNACGAGGAVDGVGSDVERR